MSQTVLFLEVFVFFFLRRGADLLPKFELSNILVELAPCVAWLRIDELLICQQSYCDPKRRNPSLVISFILKIERWHQDNTQFSNAPLTALGQAFFVIVLNGCQLN